MKKKRFIKPTIDIIEIHEMDIITTSSYVDYGDIEGNTEGGYIGGSSGEDDFDLGVKERFYHSYDLDF